MGIFVQRLDMSSTGHDAWMSYTMSARLGWTGIMSMSALLPVGVATSPHYPFNILDIGPVAVGNTTSEMTQRLAFHVADSEMSPKLVAPSCAASPLANKLTS